jgi:hypothetical protein
MLTNIHGKPTCLFLQNTLTELKAITSLAHCEKGSRYLFPKVGNAVTNNTGSSIVVLEAWSCSCLVTGMLLFEDYPKGKGDTQRIGEAQQNNTQSITQASRLFELIAIEIGESIVTLHTINLNMCKKTVVSASILSLSVLPR